MELVPIKVKIPLNSNGQHDFPNFNKIEASLRGNRDWAKFFDSHGIGWHFDKLSGHGEVDQGQDSGHMHCNNDPSCWYGVNLLPEAFCVAAAEMFPDRVTILTEAEFACFYDDRSHCHEETESLDGDVLAALKTRIELENNENAPTTAPTSEILKLRAEILDPDNPRRGIVKNKRRKWADWKLVRGITVKDRS